MKRIIHFSVKHPVTVFMGILAFVIMGLIGIYFMNIDFMPVIQKRKLLISTEYDGISAKEVKTLITKPLEDSLSSLGGMKNMTSVSRDGVSLITVELHWGTDIDLALVESREIIDAAFPLLPSMCHKPTVKAMEALNECITIAMIPNDNDLAYGRYIADYDIKSRIQRINGVGSVTISGGEKQIIEVRINKDRLDSLHSSLNSVAEVISSSNFEYPAGNIYQGERVLSVKTTGLYDDISQISRTPILYNEGGVLRLSDIGQVIDTVDEKQSFFLHNGKECIRIGIKKKKHASPIALSKDVKNELNKLKEVYGNFYSFEIIDDLSEQVINSIISMLISGIIGAVVAALIIFIFLRSIKISAMISTLIPISCLFSIFTLWIFGKSINVMSISGLAIGIGMVIDCSSVVIENIQKKFLEIQNNSEITENKSKEIIALGVEEVSLSNIGSTITTVVVFIPIFFLKGILCEIFSDMAISIIASIFISCVLSLTYIPALCVYLVPSLRKSGSQKFLQRAEKRYRKILSTFMKKKILSLFVIFISIAVGTVSFLFIDFELLPKIRSNTVEAKITLQPDTSIESIYDKALVIQNELQKISDVISIDLCGGVEKDDYEQLNNPELQKEILLITIKTNGSASVKKQIENILKLLRYNAIIYDKTDILSEVLEINDDNYILTDTEDENLLQKALEYTDETKNVIPNLVKKEYTFVPDRNANARYAISALSTASLAYNYLEGVYATPFYKDGREIPIVVKLNSSDIKNVEDLQNSFVQLQENTVPLRTLGKFEIRENEKILYRYNRKDAKIIVSPTKDVSNLISLKKLDIDEMLSDGKLLIIVVLFLLYLVMGAQFESFSIPLLLMLALPPAFSGAFLFLLVFNQTLNINSIIALVVLFGTSVNNSILLYEACKMQKTITDDSIIQCCTGKLRSIFVTNFTTIFALIPFSIDPKHINAQSSLSLAIVGGLMVSLILVLFVIPVIFAKNLKTKKEDSKTVNE